MHIGSLRRFRDGCERWLPCGGPDNKEDKPNQQPQAPIVLMGGRAFTLAELLDLPTGQAGAENRPDVMAKIEAWLDKKEKAYDQAQKRKRRPPRGRK